MENNHGGKFARALLARLWREDDGLLTFEYILLNTMLVLGTVGAVNGIRNSLNGQLNGLNESMQSLSQIRPPCLSTAANGQTGAAIQASPASVVPLVDYAPNANTTTGATSPTTTTASPTTTNGTQL